MVADEKKAGGYEWDNNKRVRFLGRDQLSIARLRALEFIRAGQEEGYEGFFWGAWIPGLFHAKIADALGTLLTHFGQPNTISQNAWTLGFHNGRIDRLPITLTSLPTYCTSRDLIFSFHSMLAFFIAYFLFRNVVHWKNMD